MYLAILFAVLLLATFGVIAWILRPTRTEADIQRHLVSISQIHSADAEGVTILKRESLSSIPLINTVLQRIPATSDLRLLIGQAGRRWTVASVLLGSLVAVVAVAWASSYFVHDVLLSLILGVSAGSIPYVYLFWQRASRFKRFEEVLPEAIDLMSRALKAGHAVTSMIEMVSQESVEPVASEFKIVFEEQNLGLPLRDAMLNLGNRVPLDDVRFLVTAVLVQKETGGNLAEILDKTALIMRERIRLKGQLRIYTAQGRMSAWVLCILPFAMFVMMSLLNPQYESKLWTDPLGIHLIYAGIIFMGLGILVIRKIIDIRV